MLNRILLWNKMARIVMDLSEKLHITPERALALFYESKVCRLLRNPDTGLYLYGDLYIADEVIRELQDKQG